MEGTFRGFSQLTSREEALQRWLRALPAQPPATEKIATLAADQRILQESFTAPHPLPAFDRSSMDGFAVHAADTTPARPDEPVRLNLASEIPMGNHRNPALKPGEAARIHTGGMLIAGADAVVMQEHTRLDEKGRLEIFQPVKAGENIIFSGEDITQGEILAQKGERLNPARIASLLAFGLETLTVSHQPRVGILSIGDELVSPSQFPQLGQVRDINSASLKVALQAWGALPHAYPILPDRREDLVNAVNTALAQDDLLVITAASSRGGRDFAEEVIQSAGSPGILVHGINIKPGKPTILAVCDGKPVIGLPGNPVSALVISALFLPAILCRLTGAAHLQRPGITSALLASRVESDPREEWIPIRIEETNGETNAVPIRYKSNLIFSLAKSDGLVCIPAGVRELAAGTPVVVHHLL